MDGENMDRIYREHQAIALLNERNSMKEKKIPIIGLTGLAGCGKDTVGTYLVRKHGFVQVAFADPIRAGVIAMFGLDEAAVYDRERKETVIPWLGKSPRQLMQTLGTEWGRELVANDVWLRVAGYKINRLQSLSSNWRANGIVISDVRFDNEAEWVKSQGGRVWRIDRNGAAGLAAETATHVSEKQVDEKHIDSVLDNGGSFESLFAQVVAIITSEGKND